MINQNLNSKNRFYQKQISDLIVSIDKAAGPGWPDMVHENVIGYVKASSVMYCAYKSIPILGEHELQGAADCLQMDVRELKDKMDANGWFLTSEILRDAFDFKHRS